ncbi:uncharacterized protein LOC104427349 [Eucalyptus grandis]|uniref:uncharacterized protein LOC104427349 n=1 Tax=Eucalyptus grandis TaxID=71139 RepID=UPI00192ECEA0|nr:uncharacterized protein LOC104427349 [Eucalyptus grandis]
MAQSKRLSAQEGAIRFIGLRIGPLAGGLGGPTPDPLRGPCRNSGQPDPFLADGLPITFDALAAPFQTLSRAAVPFSAALSIEEEGGGRRRQAEEGGDEAERRAAQYIRSRDMKVAPKVVFLFKDQDGLGPAFAAALRPDPSSDLRRLEESFELPLERYGIGDGGARGEVVHFVDGRGVYQVSVLQMESYKPPILACALNEVLAQLMDETSETMPTLLVPFISSSTNLKSEKRSLPTDSRRVSLYGLHIGRETDVTCAIMAETQKPPSSLEIHYEPLACFLQLVRVLKLPTVILVGRVGERFSEKGSTDALETLHAMGELLANNVGLCFSRDKVVWSNPSKTSRDEEEPWRALYG